MVGATHEKTITHLTEIDSTPGVKVNLWVDFYQTFNVKKGDKTIY